MKLKCFLAVAAMLIADIAGAQGFRPPPFAGGIPGRVQMQAIEMQRHQARTLLYREALEELKRNPRIVDVRECAEGEAEQSLCLPKASAGGMTPTTRVTPAKRRLAW